MVTVFPEPADLLLFFNFLLAMNVSLDTLHNSCSEWNKLPSEKTPVLFFSFICIAKLCLFVIIFFEKGEKKKKRFGRLLVRGVLCSPNAESVLGLFTV